MKRGSLASDWNLMLAGRLALLPLCVVVVGGPAQSPVSGAYPSFPLVAPVRFRNISTPAHVDFVLRNCATPHKYQIEPMVAGVAVFDYNNDDLLDIYFVNGAKIPELAKTAPEYWNRLYHNNGDGTFADATEAAGVQGAGFSMGVAAADYDNDGWEDLYVAGVNQNILYHNNGDGTFTDLTQRAGVPGARSEHGKMWSICAGWFDYDNDGWLDLFVVNYCVWGFDKDPFCGSRFSGVRVYCYPGEFDPLPNTLYHNNGDGTFTDVSATAGISEHLGKGMGVAFADYDADGYQDVFVANDTTRNFLFHNNGDGTFTELALRLGVAYNADGAALSYMGADFRDVDNDGLPDLFVTAISNEMFSYFHNEGGQLFDDFTHRSLLGRLSIFSSGWSNGIFDLNNDGWKDLFSSNSHVNDRVEMELNVPFKQKNAVYANLGGQFANVSAAAGNDFQVAAAHRGAAFGDLDNDGKIDVVVSRFDAPAEVFHNISANGHHWLMIKAVGTRSNRDGIGVRIKLESESGTQYNHVTTSVGYASSSDRRVHFGLGKDKVVKSLEILWPSGARQVLTDIPADQTLTITEPVSLAR